MTPEGKAYWKELLDIRREVLDGKIGREEMIGRTLSIHTEIRIILGDGEALEVLNEALESIRASKQASERSEVT